jgi:glycosyltransferase involved in cell wall biosynthesis
VTLTTPGAVRLYHQRYPHFVDKVHLLENGYDEETFVGTEAGAPLNPGKITLLHSGIVYPQERDPTSLFTALATLKERNPELTNRLRLRFRAPAHEDLLVELSKRFGITELIELMPPVGYREALNEMLSADALMILQSNGCNDQIPVKIYEYLRAGRPIIALTDDAGDTAQLLKKVGIEAIAPLNDSVRIADMLVRVISNFDKQYLPSFEVIQNFSRKGRTYQLARLFEKLL